MVSKVAPENFDVTFNIIDLRMSPRPPKKTVSFESSEKAYDFFCRYLGVSKEWDKKIVEGIVSENPYDEFFLVNPMNLTLLITSK